MKYLLLKYCDSKLFLATQRKMHFEQLKFNLYVITKQ